MRALWLSVVLLVTVIAAVCVNTALLSKKLDDVAGKIGRLPKDRRVYETMSDEEREECRRTLHDIADAWDEDSVYRFCSVRHTVSTAFDATFDAGVSYYDSGEYAEFLAQMACAGNALDQLRFGEGLSFGNLL